MFEEKRRKLEEELARLDEIEREVNSYTKPAEMHLSDNFVNHMLHYSVLANSGSYRADLDRITMLKDMINEYERNNDNVLFIHQLLGAYAPTMREPMAKHTRYAMKKALENGVSIIGYYPNSLEKECIKYLPTQYSVENGYGYSLDTAKLWLEFFTDSADRRYNSALESIDRLNRKIKLIKKDFGI